MYSAKSPKHSRAGISAVSIATVWLLHLAPSAACTFHRPREIAELSKGDLVFRGKVLSYMLTRAPRISGKPRVPDVGTMSFVVVETLRGPVKAEWTITLVDAGMGLGDNWKTGDDVIVAANSEPSELAPRNFVMRQKLCSDLPIFLDNENNLSLALRALM